MAKVQKRATTTAGAGASRPAAGGISKAQFILSQPMNLTARQVVDRAKDVGLSITESYVHVIRSKYRRGKIRKKDAAELAASPRSAGDGSSTALVQFRRLALLIGLNQAQAELDNLKKKVEAIIAGG